MQDAYNFGKGSAYYFDPEIRGLDTSIDGMNQIDNSAMDSGAMRTYFDLVYRTGEFIGFSYLNKQFNSDLFSAIKSSHWSIGRYLGDATGTISVNGEGQYTVSGSSTIQSDDFNWDLDGSGLKHNFGILTLNGNVNGPGLGNMLHSSVISENWGPTDGMSGSTRQIGSGYVYWGQPSPSIPMSGLETQYTRQYNFTFVGIPD